MLPEECQKCHECSNNPYIEELIEFMGDDFSHERMHLAAKDLADQWNERNRPMIEDISEFYHNAKTYLYDLTSWHGADPSRGMWTETVKKFVKENNCKTILDFGCGIGNDGLALLDLEGVSVDFVDLSCPCLDFLDFRIKKRGIEDRCNVIRCDDVYMPEKHYDFVICIDVIEHLCEVEKIMSNLFNHCDMIIMTVQGYEKIHPMHLPKNNKFTIKIVLDSLIAELGFELCDDLVIPFYRRIPCTQA